MRLIIIQTLIIILLLSCANDNKKQKDEVITTTVEVKEDKQQTTSNSISEEPTQAEKNYPKEMCGVWGNFEYLDKMREYNSVTLAEQDLKDHPEIELKIDNSIIVFDHPKLMEPQILDSKYVDVFIGSDSLYLLDTIRNDTILYKKIKDLPTSISVWGVYGDEYSAVAHMKFEWFAGNYQWIHVKQNSTEEVYFYKDGFLSDNGNGISYSIYSNDVITKDDSLNVFQEDCLLLGLGENDYRYYVMEYEQGVFNCFSIEEFEDWDEPFIKNELQFQLIKKDE